MLPEDRTGGCAASRSGARKKVLPVLCFLPLLFSLLGVSAHAEDLLAVYRRAAATSPVLAQARAQLRAEEANRPLARSCLLPRLLLGAGVGRNHADITGFPAFAVDQSYTAANYSVTLTQPLFNGPAYSSLKVADAQVRAGEADLEAAEQDLILQVVQAYFGVLRAQAEVKVARGRRGLLKKILAQAEAFRAVGSGDIIAVQEARARFDAAASDLIGAENALEVARQGVERLTHRPPGPLVDVGAIRPRMPKPDNAEAWVKQALKRQPLLAAARERWSAARDQVTVARRARWPRLSLDAGYRYSKGEFLPSIDREDLQVGLNLSFPLYQGGEIGAQSRRALARAEAARHGMDTLRDRIRYQVESAFSTLKSSAADLRATARALASAEVSLDATRKGYAIGSRSIVDLLNEVQNDTVARRNDYLALYRHVVDRIRLKAAAGVLGTGDVEAVNALLRKGVSD